MLDLKLLSTFREVAVRGSFSEAATALGYTQPAVSQHIGRLERELGTRLLDRKARAVHPTPAGDVLLRHAATLLDGARRAEDDVRSFAGAQRPRVRLGAFQSAASGLLPEVARELRQTPIRLEFRIVEPGPALDDLRAGRLDVALATESDLTPAAPVDGVDLLPVCEDEMLVVVPVDHRLAHHAVVDLADLRDEPWVITEVGGTCADSNVVLRACRDAGFDPDIRLETDDYHALQGMAAAGMGVAMLPRMATTSVRDDVVVLTLRGRAPVRRILAAVAAGERPEDVDRVVEALRNAALVVSGRPALRAA
jgi:DNA-binding transcriptional LysR family regulator